MSSKSQHYKLSFQKDFVNQATKVFTFSTIKKEIYSHSSHNVDSTVTEFTIYIIMKLRRFNGVIIYNSSCNLSILLIFTEVLNGL